MKREGYRPARDLILALTADEEGGPANGIDWLVKNHRALIDAEFCINTDAGYGELQNGKRILLGLQAAEKTYLSFKLEAANPGGHSSQPRKDNAIYRLAEALARLAKYDFPVHLFDVTRAFFERRANLSEGQDSEDMKRIVRDPNDSAALGRLSEDPYFNSQLRTTCVATQLAAGHAENALPQRATATVNCRILPIETPAEVRRLLVRVIDDPEIAITEMNEPIAPLYKPIDSRVTKTLEAAAQKVFPGIPVVPYMDTGATDSSYLLLAGITSYGAHGIFLDENRAHGRDERILVQSFDEGANFLWEAVTLFGMLP